MRAKGVVFSVAIGMLVIGAISGCAPKVIPVVPSGPAINYPEKINATVAVLFDEDLTTYIDRFSITEDFCAGHTYDIMLGNGMVDAVKSALEAVFTNVVVVDTVPEMDKYDAVARVTLESVDNDAEITELTFGHKVKVRYDISITVNLLDKNLKLIYPYNASAIGTRSNKVTSCSEIGDIIAESAEKCLNKISTDIAQALYSAQQVQDYFNKK